MTRSSLTGPAFATLLLACTGSGPGAANAPPPPPVVAVRLEGGGATVTVDSAGVVTGTGLDVPVGAQIVHVTFLDDQGQPARLPDSSDVEPLLVPGDATALTSDRTGPWQFHLHGLRPTGTWLVASLRQLGSDSLLLAPLNVPVVVRGATAPD